VYHVKEDGAVAMSEHYASDLTGSRSSLPTVPTLGLPDTTPTEESVAGTPLIAANPTGNPLIAKVASRRMRIG
jgi:hypothetical protein